MLTFLHKLYSWYGRRTVWSVAGLAVLLIITGVYLSTRGNQDTEMEDEGGRAVSVARVADLSNLGSITVIGEVESISQAIIDSEVSGRVTSVPVKLGDTLKPGQIIGQVENATQRAQLLQAEGFYEAALAAAAQNESSKESAATALKAAEDTGFTTYRNAYATIDDTIRNTVDVVFSDPTGPIPGLRINGLSMTLDLNNERKALESVLKNWGTQTQVQDSSEAKTLLTSALSDTIRIAVFIQDIANVASNEKNDDVSINGNNIESIRNDLALARVTINNIRQSIESAITMIETGEEALVRAEIAGSGLELSGAEAQVKQALGQLRAAEANLEKTIFRSPIGGTLNQLNIETGDFVSAFMTVARVANNEALEITAFVNESERNRIAVGDSVRIDEQYDGVITNIAPAVDSITKKIEVQIGTESTELVNGDSVRISLQGSTSAVDEIVVPITALKVETDRIIVFTVSDENTLVANQVSEGPIVGTSIVIREGLTPDMEIVLDARGRNEGDKVTVMQ